MGSGIRNANITLDPHQYSFENQHIPIGRDQPVVIGIDPGLYGAIVVLNMNGQVVAKYRFKTIPKEGNAVVKSIIDGGGIFRFLSAWEWVEVAYLESPTPVPANGMVRNASLFHSIGGVENILQALEIRYVRIPPKQWKKRYGLQGGKKYKKDAITVALKLNPELGNLKVGEADIAEANLIGRYGLKYLWNNTNQGENDA